MTIAWVPDGSDQIAHFARMRNLQYRARPEEMWFRAWEPHDTMISPELYLNSVTAADRIGNLVVCEPWTTYERGEPLERCLVGFANVELRPRVSMPRALQRRAAMRVGEPFLTKVTFLESPPPPRVSIGDAVWDEHVTTFAASASEANIAFPKALRSLLQKRGFEGHLEIRPGGFVVHMVGLVPRPDHYDLLFRALGDIRGALMNS
jgi:hypothetical protein